jgi:putative N6-adenine-specific DNA methylase
MYNYQRTNLYFAQIADDLKEPGAEELADLGARNIKPDYRGIYFKADKAALYRINYSSRLISRILAPLVSFGCNSTDGLYENAKRIPWWDFLSVDQTFAVFGNVSDSNITHSQYASLRLKDAIADSFREKLGKRPDVDTRDPRVWINLHIRKNRATISIDVSGGSLHRRGYREASVPAPMQETVAAAIIRYTKWDGSLPIYDPMCGSGTLLSEALMNYCRIPAGTLRSRFGFQALPDFEKGIWEKVKESADNKIRPLPEGLISGSDISKEAVDAARKNNRNLPQGGGVVVNRLDFNTIDMTRAVIVANPPYGIRMGTDMDLNGFYKSLGDFLKQRCKNSTAYIYFGERAFIKKIGLKASWKKPLKAGGLDGRLAKYELY